MNARRVDFVALRRSEAAARAIVGDFVPRRYLRSLVAALAHSVRCADRANPAKWGLRLNPDSVMLKVGFVEVLQLGAGWFHQLVRSDLVPAKLRFDGRLRFSNPRYRNAPECEACDFDLPSALAMYSGLLTAHEAAIEVAANSRRHTTTTHDHSPGLIAFLANELGSAIPQPEYLVQEPEFAPSIPEEVPADEEFAEGAVTQVLVNRYERDPEARRRCIAHYGATCAACGLTMRSLYGPDVDGLIHVHHLTPLSESRKSAVNAIRDLRPVCPNCHAVIHATRPPRTLEQVRAMAGLRAIAQPDSADD
jgi:hypothetical protein